VREEPLTDQMDNIAKRHRFGVVGSWAGWVRQTQLTWGGIASSGLPTEGALAGGLSWQYFFVRIGSEGSEGFQLLQDLDWDRVIHPSRHVESTTMPHTVMMSPLDIHIAGLTWTIGEADGAVAGDVFMVRVECIRDRVRKVYWHKAQPGPEIDAAIASNSILMYA